MVHTNFFPAKNFNLITNPNLTYQKANEMALNYFFDDLNRINTAKFKIEEKLQLIPYVYSLLFSKIYSRTNNFGIRKKNNFDFHFTTWKNKKRGSIGPKILKQLQIKYFQKRCCIFDCLMDLLKIISRFSLIYQVIMKNLNIIKRFLLLQIRVLL